VAQVALPCRPGCCHALLLPGRAPGAPATTCCRAIASLRLPLRRRRQARQPRLLALPALLLRPLPPLLRAAVRLALLALACFLPAPPPPALLRPLKVEPHLAVAPGAAPGQRLRAPCAQGRLRARHGAYCCCA
jgi:hypothetical protein